MGFEKIGPFELTRRDRIVNHFALSFLIGSTRIKVVGYWFLILGLISTLLGFMLVNIQLLILGPFSIIFMFLVLPAIISTNYFSNLYIEYSPEGIVFDSPKSKTTFKWHAIGPIKKIGSRLIVMVSGASSVVISDRSTSRENMANLMATIAHHKNSEIGK